MKNIKKIENNNVILKNNKKNNITKDKINKMKILLYNL